jgi:peptidoglycan hydrolase-like protein with peptidoglycan-binding domain
MGSVFTIIQMVLQFAPLVKAAIDIASSNEGLVAKIKEISPTVATMLEEIGATLFPKAAPALHIVGGAIAAFDTNTTKWLQGALNAMLVPSPNLVVDGIYGVKTRDAVYLMQAKLGLKIDGLAGQITQAAIAAALANFHFTIPATATGTGAPAMVAAVAGVKSA